MSETAAVLSPAPKTRLFNKNFLLLWLGQMVSQLGDSLFYFAITIWMIPKYGLTSLAWIMAAVGLPSILIGPFAGAIVDRVNRKTIIWLSDIIRGFLMFIVVYVVYSNTHVIASILGIMVISNVVSAFFNPAIGASLPNIVDAGNLSRANSLRQGTQAITTILGPAIGGVLLVIIGSASDHAILLLVLLDGLSYLISGISEMFITMSKPKREKSAVHPVKAILSEFKDGFYYIIKNRILFRMIIVFMIINFFLAPIFDLIVPGYVISDLNSKSWVGFIQSASAVGLITASALLTIFKARNHYRYILISLSAVGISTLILGISMFLGDVTMLPVLSILLTILVMGVIIGMSATVVNIKMATIFQVIIPDEMRGRVFAWMSTVSTGLIPLSMAITGFIVIYLHLFYVSLASGIMIIFAVILFSRIKGIKELLIEMEEKANERN